VADTRVGDTVTDEKRAAAEPLPDFKEAQAVVFAGFFPSMRRKFEDLREAMGRFGSMMRAFPMTWNLGALGFGFRCGFLGLLHLEITRERIEREFNVDIITTAPASSTRSICVTARRSRCTIRSTCRTPP
jgi:GTP-binding protein LepA